MHIEDYHAHSHSVVGGDSPYVAMTEGLAGKGKHGSGLKASHGDSALRNDLELTSFALQEAKESTSKSRFHQRLYIYVL